jgi:hypothetical protein
MFLEYTGNKNIPCHPKIITSLESGSSNIIYMPRRISPRYVNAEGLEADDKSCSNR